MHSLAELKAINDSVVETPVDNTFAAQEAAHIASEIDDKKRLLNNLCRPNCKVSAVYQGFSLSGPVNYGMVGNITSLGTQLNANHTATALVFFVPESGTASWIPVRHAYLPEYNRTLAQIIQDAKATPKVGSKERVEGWLASADAAAAKLKS